MTKGNKNKWWLNGGRGSGRTFRLLCEVYENKIADLKANCDLAIEGRDVKIMELEKELNYQKQARTIAENAVVELEQKNKELEKRLVFARAEFQRQYKENAELKEKLALRKYAD
jgi:hypothetical protein